MYLTIDELPHYLMARGLLTADQIVAGDLGVVEDWGRHRHFRVLRNSACSLFVKQPRQADPGLQRALEREARLYGTVGTDDRFQALRLSVPRQLDYDPRRHVLTLELVPAARSLTQLRRERADEFHPTGRAAASALAKLHALETDGPSLAADLDLPRRPVRILTVLREQESTEGFACGDPPCVAALRQHPGLCQALHAMFIEWQYDSLIHGDVKGDNVLAGRAGSCLAGPYLVDWELAAWGDSAWDLAGLFACALGENPHSPHELAVVPDWNATCEQWWDGYRKARWPASEAAAGFLPRVQRYVGARQLQTVLERSMQTAMPAWVLSEWLAVIDQRCQSRETRCSQFRENVRR